MDTRQLLYFRAVVDHGSFTHAAESLDMTQPSLSLSIRKLEKELNAQLLSRGRSGVSTTEAGDYVYETAVKVDSLLSETQRHISEITGDKASTVSLASGAILNWEFTPAALAELKRIYPTANISLDDAEPATAIKHLLDGQVDLALLPTSDPKAFIRRYSPELTVHQVATFDYSVALPQRLAELESPVSLADLKKETWLVPPRSRELPELAEFYQDLWNSRPGLKPEKTQEVASLNSAIPMVSSGLGVSIVPNCAPTVQPHGIITRPIADDLPRYYAIVAYRTDRELTAATQDLVDILRSPQRTLA